MTRHVGASTSTTMVATRGGAWRALVMSWSQSSYSVVGSTDWAARTRVGPVDQCQGEQTCGVGLFALGGHSPSLYFLEVE